MRIEGLIISRMQQAESIRRSAQWLRFSYVLQKKNA
jgi:hypothetical protein